jgi:hypothetical protein
MTRKEYNEAYIELCLRLKHDIESLLLVGKLDIFVGELEEKVDNLTDPEER